MKKLVFTVLMIAAGISAFAAPGAVSNKAISHFSSNFSKAANATWRSESKFDKVSFTTAGETMHAFYSHDGELLGTSKTMAFDKLPAKAITTLTTKYTYPTYQLKECIEFVSPEGEKNYYVSFATQNGTLALEISNKGRVSLFSKM